MHCWTGVVVSPEPIFSFSRLFVAHVISQSPGTVLSSSDDFTDVGRLVDWRRFWLADGCGYGTCVPCSRRDGFTCVRRNAEKGLGLLYMAGPTGGYLVGFALAAAITGWLAERGLDRSVIGTAIAMVAGNVVIYACGFVWLSTFVGIDKAVTFGMAPFLFGDLVKIALATVMLPMIWKFLNRHQL